MKKLILFLILLSGFLVIYFTSASDEALPSYGKVETFKAESAYGGEYDMAVDRNKFVVFFFTNCPDICPLTLADLSKIQTDFAKEDWLGEQLDIVAITLDPGEDTPEQIRRYADNFVGDAKGWHWLRTSEAATKEIADHFQMVYQKLNDGTLTHSTTMYLVDKTGEIRGIYSMATSKKAAETEGILRDIELLVK